MKRLILLTLVSACSDGYRLGQREAETIVWYGEFRQTEKPPLVVWEDTDGCLEGARCPAGLFYPDEYWAKIAWRSKGRISATAYVHELLHAKHALQNIYDPDHELPEWREAERINELLKSQGL